MPSNGKFEYWLTVEGLTLLEGWARDGLTDGQIAHNAGIARSTLYQWKARFPVISDALKKGKEVADYEVENALYKRAVGYRYTEVTRELRRDPDTGDLELVVTKRVDKEAPPDVTAQIYWLKNRRPDKWRDRPAADSGNEEETGVLILAPVEVADGS